MYLLELSRFLGFEPMNDFDEELRTQFDLLDGNFVNVSNTSKYLLPVERSIFVRQLLSADMKQLEHIRIPKDIRNEILKDIIKFYRLHVDNFREPKSLAVIQAILR
jgi:DNA repair protein RecO (recombination protein O)